MNFSVASAACGVEGVGKPKKKRTWSTRNGGSKSEERCRKVLGISI